MQHGAQPAPLSTEYQFQFTWKTGSQSEAPLLSAEKLMMNILRREEGRGSTDANKRSRGRRGVVLMSTRGRGGRGGVVLMPTRGRGGRRGVVLMSTRGRGGRGGVVLMPTRGRGGRGGVVLMSRGW